jgi:hypothetical protein
VGAAVLGVTGNRGGCGHGGVADLGRTGVSPTGQGAAAIDALLAGLVLPQLAGAALFSVLMAANIRLVTLSSTTLVDARRSGATQHPLEYRSSSPGGGSR